ncbi:MAG: hypothetical protein ACTS3F_06345 [Phycisphaerales bacterium]
MAFEFDDHLRYDQRAMNRSRPPEQVHLGWVGNELLSVHKHHLDDLSQTDLPPEAQHFLNLAVAQSMMPETGPGYGDNEMFDAWCDAYRAVGLDDLAALLESVRDIRFTDEKEARGIVPTEAEEAAVQEVADAISVRHKEVYDARYRYMMKHRAIFEAISPAIKAIFEHYDAQASDPER